MPPIANHGRPSGPVSLRRMAEQLETGRGSARFGRGVAQVGPAHT